MKPDEGIEKVNKVLVHRHMGYDIFYDKKRNRFVANRGDMGGSVARFESHAFWEIVRDIGDLGIVPVSEERIMTSYNENLMKVRIVAINKARPGWVSFQVLDHTSGCWSRYTTERDDFPVLYPLTKHNRKIYEEVKNLRRTVKSEIERRVQAKIASLEGAKPGVKVR